MAASLSPTAIRPAWHWAIFVLILGGGVAHHAAFWGWFIEDAAISMAYAVRLAEGDGLVPYVGGERIEGYSNPTWVFLLALMHAIGLDVFEGTRWLQFVLSIATYPLMFKAAEEAVGRKDSLHPLFATAFLAASSLFAMWGGAGLENSLLHLLLVVALWLGFREWRSGAWPWSAFVWFLIAITRPEAPLFVFVGGGVWIVFAMQKRGSIRPALQWAATCLAPFSLYHWVRYQYFAWALPNTYYAKLDHKPNDAYGSWDMRPWRWSRRFYHEVGVGYFLPVWVVALLGHTRIRLALVVSLTFGAVLTLAGTQAGLPFLSIGGLWTVAWLVLSRKPDAPSPLMISVSLLASVVLIVALTAVRTMSEEPPMLPVPEPFGYVAMASVPVLALCLPFFARQTEQFEARVQTWALAWAGTFFAIYAQGDWMQGYRWYAFPTIPAALLFSFGVNDVTRWIQVVCGDVAEGWTRIRGAAATALVAALIPFNIQHTLTVHERPDPTPRTVKIRANYVMGLQQRAHIEDRMVDLDIDQGAHLLWTDFKMLDIAGLVDIPMGHHKFRVPFLKEYLFAEQKPHYIHLRGSWVQNSGLKKLPEWRQDYVRIPGYPVGPSVVVGGNYLRRDVLFEPSWNRSGHAPTTYENGLTLHGYSVPSSPSHVGAMYVEVGMSFERPPKSRARSPRVVMFLANAAGAVYAWDIPPAYDWVPVSGWRKDEVFVGKYTFELHDGMSPGAYDVGFVVMDANGNPLTPVATKAPVHETSTAAFAAGEIRWPRVLAILPKEKAIQAANERLAEAKTNASNRACFKAETSWRAAQKHIPTNQSWQNANAGAMADILATCWAVRSDDAPDQKTRHRHLLKARSHNHRLDAVSSRTRALGSALLEAGMVARHNSDWEAAYRAFADAVEVDPTLSWARRYAEEARVERLQLAELPPRLNL